MKTDYLDVVQFHFSPAKEVLEQEEAIQTLRDLQRAGKIRFLGCSSTLPNIRSCILSVPRKQDPDLSLDALEGIVDALGATVQLERHLSIGLAFEVEIQYL